MEKWHYAGIADEFDEGRRHRGVLRRDLAVIVGDSWRVSLPVSLGLAEPQRDMRGLNRLLDYGLELLSEPLQVHLAPQGVGEPGQSLRSIVIPAVESPVDETLDPPPDRLEERGDNQRRDDDATVPPWSVTARKAS